MHFMQVNFRSWNFGAVGRSMVFEERTRTPNLFPLIRSVFFFARDDTWRLLLGPFSLCMRGPMAVDVALHKADRETQKVIPAEPKKSFQRTSFVGLVLVTETVPERGPSLQKLVRVGAEVWPQKGSHKWTQLNAPLGRSPRGAGRTASRGLGAGGKQHLAFDSLRTLALYLEGINKR